MQYAGPNPVAFDIANHWCEYGADYHTDLPHLLDYTRMPQQHQQVSGKTYLHLLQQCKGRENIILIYPDKISNCAFVLCSKS